MKISNFAGSFGVFILVAPIMATPLLTDLAAPRGSTWSIIAREPSDGPIIAREPSDGPIIAREEKL